MFKKIFTIALISTSYLFAVNGTLRSTVKYIEHYEDNIRVYLNNSIPISGAAPFTSDGMVNDGSYGYVLILLGNPGYPNSDQLLSLMLTAMSTGKEVYVHYSDGGKYVLAATLMN